MKILMLTLFYLLAFVNVNSQEINNYDYVHFKQERKVLINTKKVMLFNSLSLKSSFQFGNMFMTLLEAEQAQINLKNFFSDYDLGFNIKMNYLSKKYININAIYNIGLLKFDSKNNTKPRSCIAKVAFNYSF